MAKYKPHKDIESRKNRKARKIITDDLMTEEQKRSSAKSRFETEVARFRADWISDADYLAIAKNLHRFQKAEDRASVKIADLRRKESSIDNNGPNDDVVTKLEGRMLKFRVIFVSTLAEARFVVDWKLAHKVAIVAPSKPQKVEIQWYCRDNGLKFE